MTRGPDEARLVVLWGWASVPKLRTWLDLRRPGVEATDLGARINRCDRHPLPPVEDVEAGDRGDQHHRPHHLQRLQRRAEADRGGEGGIRNSAVGYPSSAKLEIEAGVLRSAR